MGGMKWQMIRNKWNLKTDSFGEPEEIKRMVDEYNKQKTNIEFTLIFH